MPTAVTETATPGRLSGWALVALAFVFLAVALEVLGGQYSNSEVPAAARFVVPLAWPQAVRALWWVLVGSAAAGYRYAEHRAGIRRNPVVIAASVAPFFVFAGGVAAGASFSTWH